MHILLIDKIVQNCLQRQADGDCPTVDSFSTEMLEDCITQLDANQQSLNRLHETAQATIEQLQADNARLREAVELEEKAYQYPTDSEDALSGWGRSQLRRKALASTDSSNWLAEQKAQWRREVIKEVLNEAQGDNKDAYIHSEKIAEVVRRRLAEQPESNCACYPDDKDADKRQCNECPR